ncbi:hypothetical protein WJX75_008141 [Coccomyxa subellipsoidea]|uniref:RWP-RK domain-containing protein n=1 Tax=Coccomyxa subellipsoidea TaxID=248742 RepID=A0ABR2Z4P1_9CHLO
MPWGTPDNLMPSRHFRDSCFDLLEGSSSTPWSTAGDDEELLLDLFRSKDLDSVLLAPIVGGESEFGYDLSDLLRMAPPDQTIRGREAEVDSLQHPSSDSSFCSTVSVPEKAPEKDPAQAAQGRTRRGKERRRMPNNDPAEWLTMEYLESGGFFDMPLAEAARRLNMSAAVLKPKVRQLGVQRWPSRKRNSLRRLMESALIIGKPINRGGFDGDITELSKLLEAECKSYQGDSENWPIIQKVRHTFYKTRFLQKRRRIEPKCPSTPPPAAPLFASASSCSLTPPMNRQGTPMQLNAPLEGRPFRGPPAARPGSTPPGVPPGVAWGGHGSRERRRCGRQAASIF